MNYQPPLPPPPELREPLTEAQFVAWCEQEFRKGWQDDIYIPRWSWSKP